MGWPINELILVIVSGLVFGSFITLASYRLPRGQDIIIQSSRCTACNTRLGFKDLWPVLSWVLAKARCRHCGTRISARYPLIEIVTAALFFLIYARYGLTAQGIILALMGVVLLIMIIVDIEHYLIPDEVHYVLLPLGIAWHYVTATPMEDVAEGFFTGAAIGLVLHYGYRHLRKKEGLGFGDVKFMAVAGLWLGLKPLVPFLFFSGIFGVITGLAWRALKRGPIFPFGPSLALALFVCVAFPELPNMFWNIGLILNKQ